MKKRITLSALLFLAPFAWAASPFLPITATNTFRSAERAIVEKAMSDAEAQGKLVLIDMAAAWCGPCLNLEKDMEAKKAALQPTLDHFIYIKLEEMHLEMMAGADFLPHEIPWFPSLFVYNPANQKWSWLYTFDADGLNQTLKDYMANGGVATLYMNNLNSKIQQGVKIELDDILQALTPMAVEESGATLLANVGQILSAIKANPTQFAFSMSEFEEGVGEPYKRAMERGQLTLAEIRAVDPEAFKNLDAPTTYRIQFVITMGKTIRLEGNKAASDKCETVAGEVAGLISGERPELRADLGKRMELQCLLLKVQLKEKNGADVTAYVNALTPAEREKYSYSLMRVFAMTGTNYQDAITYGKPWKAAYEKAYAKSAELLARIIKATDERMAAYAAGKSHP